MGNTVSAAEAVAAGIAKPATNESTIHHHTHPHYDKNAVPPPECPMHQKVAPQPAKEECPVKHRTGDEINPYNMVCVLLIYFLVFIVVFLHTHAWVGVVNHVNHAMC